MSCKETFSLLGYVNPIRVPTWTLPIRIYLGIWADNKFKIPDLFMRVNFYSEPLTDHRVRTIKTFKSYLDYIMQFTSDKICYGC
jgi:hypothetical protein